MRWRYEESDRTIRIDKKYRKFSGKLHSEGHMIIPSYVIKYLEEQLSIPRLHQNCELVVELKGMMLPPRNWVKIEELESE